jgi:hypothetical protein
MDRRAFFGMAAAVPGFAGAGFAQGSPKKTGCYVLQHYYLQLGSQATRLADYLSKIWLPALAKAHSGPTLVLDAQLATHLPLVTRITGYQSVEEMWSVRAKLKADKALEAATDAWQSGPEPPFESMTTALLDAEDFSPEIAPLNPQPKTPRTFELRVYQTRTARELRGLIGRFREGEAKILAKAGSANILFASTAIGQDHPNLTWLMGFEDMAAREKFSAAFAADPDWIKLRAESVQRWGQIPSIRRLTLYRAANYSPIR